MKQVNNNNNNREEKNNMAANVTLTANKSLREEMKRNRITLWMIADVLETTDATICRKLRHELPDDEMKRFKDAMKQIIAAR